LWLSESLVPVLQSSGRLLWAVHRKPGSPYNQPLLPKPLSAAGKATIAIAGFVWGFFRSVQTPEAPSLTVPLSRLGEIEERMEKLESLMIRLPIPPTPREPTPREPTHREPTHQEEGRAGRSHHESKPEDFITSHQLAEALARTEKRLETSIVGQFGTQNLAIGALRTMITNTDALLERILGRLESAAQDAAE
jgi:hypothetical protein